MNFIKRKLQIVVYCIILSNSSTNVAECPLHLSHSFGEFVGFCIFDLKEIEELDQDDVAHTIQVYNQVTFFVHSHSTRGSLL